MPGPSENQPDHPPFAPSALHAPWRLEYLEALTEQEKKIARSGGKQSTGSFLRDYWITPDADEQNHVIVRTGEGLVLLNRYPYANGHLLVALGEARPRLLEYEPEHRAKLWSLVDLAADLMDHTIEPQGINIGINEGRAAGAGVPTHLHVHLVPRWSGDVNFMAAVGQVRVIPAALEAMAHRYRETWSRLRETYGL